MYETNHDKHQIKPSAWFGMQQRHGAKYDKPYLKIVEEFQKGELPSQFIKKNIDQLSMRSVEDDLRINQLAFLFPADWLENARGSLVLLLSFDNEVLRTETIEEPEQLEQLCNEISLDASSGTVLFNIPNEINLKYQWGYSLHPQVRVAPLVDPRQKDVYDDDFKNVVHLTYLMPDEMPVPTIEVPNKEFKKAKIEFDFVFTSEIKKIQHSEEILDELNSSFAHNDEFLIWDREKIRSEEFDEQINKIKKNANIAFRSSEKEIRSTSRLRPTVKYQITIVDQEDIKQVGEISIAVDQ